MARSHSATLSPRRIINVPPSARSTRPLLPVNRRHEGEVCNVHNRGAQKYHQNVASHRRSWGPARPRLPGILFVLLLQTRQGDDGVRLQVLPPLPEGLRLLHPGRARGVRGVQEPPNRRRRDARKPSGDERRYRPDHHQRRRGPELLPGVPRPHRTTRQHGGAAPYRLHQWEGVR